MLPLGAELRLGVMFFTLVCLYMFMHSHPGKVSLRAAQMHIDSTMLEKCLNTGLLRVGPSWSVEGGRPDLRKGSW